VLPSRPGARRHECRGHGPLDVQVSGLRAASSGPPRPPLGELLGSDLSALDLVALMVDGVHFAEHLVVVAMGIGIDGTKHPLGLAEGSTEKRHAGEPTCSSA